MYMSYRVGAEIAVDSKKKMSWCSFLIHPEQTLETVIPTQSHFVLNLYEIENDNHYTFCWAGESFGNKNASTILKMLKPSHSFHWSGECRGESPTSKEKHTWKVREITLLPCRDDRLLYYFLQMKYNIKGERCEAWGEGYGCERRSCRVLAFHTKIATYPDFLNKNLNSENHSTVLNEVL